MKQTSVRQFLKLREQLEAERTEIVARLTEVEAALGASELTASKATVKPAVAKVKKRVQNELSLKEAIVKAVRVKEMTKEEILTAVQKLGYKFNTKNPLNSMSVVLYGKKPKFKNQNGKFSVA